MTTKDDGGPAFPVMAGAGVCAIGMTLRDWFAGQALASLGDVNPNLPGDWADPARWPDASTLAMRRATFAFMQADAMLAARAKGGAE